MVRKRENGKYWVRIWDPATRTQKHVGTFESELEARAAEIQALANRETKQYVPKDATVRDYAERWLEYAKVKWQRSTYEHNKYMLQKFVTEFGDRALRDVSRSEAKAWALEHPQYFPVARTMFSEAVRDELVDRNPLTGLKLAQNRGRARRGILTKGEVGMLVEIAREVFDEPAPGEYDMREMMSAMILVAGYTGMRPGEIYALEWGSVDWRTHEISVTRQYRSKTDEYAEPKRSKSRRVVMPPVVEDALRGLPHSEGPVFRTTRGAHYTGRSHHYYWNQVRQVFLARVPRDRRKDFGHLEFYELRHFCATYLAVDMSLPAWVVAEQLGHSDGGALVMSLYAHPRTETALAQLHESYERPEPEAATG